MNSEKPKITVEDVLALKKELENTPKEGGPIQVIMVSVLPARTIMVSEDLWEDVKKLKTKFQ